MPVQWVNRPNLDFRGFAGLIAAGVVRPGDPHPRAAVGPRERRSRASSPRTATSTQAVAGQSVTLTLRRRDRLLARRRDLGRRRRRPQVADQFEATIVWMADEPMLPGRAYLLKIGTQTGRRDQSPSPSTRSTSTRWSTWPAKQLELNEIGVCNLQSRPARSPSIPTRTTATLGGFILIDRLTNATVGAGTASTSPCAASQNIHWQALDVNKAARAQPKGQRACVLWFTGLSGAGKSTIANLVEKKLHADGPPHLSAGRRQRPPRAQPGPGLHRRRPGGEHPPRRRGGAS